MYHDLSKKFPRYERFDPKVPVYCVTPNLDRTIHRFFDTSPFSPSGRYLGLTRLPFEDRLPSPGDVAEIVLVDLATGEERIVAETRGWDTQLGAQVQWGVTDNQLYYNDVDTITWNAYGVVLDPFSGKKKVLDGTVYMISPDGKWALSPCLLRMSLIQPGYGVLVPPDHVPVNHGKPTEDGIFITDTDSGETRLLVSLQEIVETATPNIELKEFINGDFYCFHVKWNQQSDRLMMVLRWIPRDKGSKTRSQVITMKADGSDIRVTILASQWDSGGHHPNWCPDGESIMMNLRVMLNTRSRIYHHLPGKIRKPVSKIMNFQDNGMRLVHARYDGGNFGVMKDNVCGTGHPSMHPNGRFVVTDAYPSEPVAFGDGSIPIRFIDLDTGQEIALVRINTTPPYSGPNNELRIDPHPAWDREFRQIAFNACSDGTRRVYIADLASKVN